VPVPDAKPWSPDAPHLHTLTVSMGGQSVTERFGLRRFGVDKATARLTLNGEVAKLVGWNHHTQWPVTAASPTDEQLDADIALLRKGGANLVRGAHYPHDPRWLDRLDEAGILFWSETLGPAVSVANTKDWAFFMVHQKRQLSEMIDNAINHAAVFAWGWFNEGPSDHPEACPAYGACSALARARDPTRFTTWADDHKTSGALLRARELSPMRGLMIDCPSTGAEPATSTRASSPSTTTPAGTRPSRRVCGTASRRRWPRGGERGVREKEG